MFSVVELSKRYKVTRQTIYRKINMDEMKPYIVDNDGIKVKSEGLEVLNVLLGNSKAVHHKHTESESSVQDECYNDTIYMDKYIKSLEQQIFDLKSEKAIIQEEKADIQEKYNSLLERILNLEQKKLEGKQGFFSWLKK